MTCVIRTCYFLMASYYIIAVCANMPDMKTIKSKIEVEIEVEKIKNNIIQKLRGKGAQLNLRLATKPVTDDTRISTVKPTGGPRTTLEVEGSVFPTGIPPQSQPKSKPLIVIGEPRSKSKKDKCLTFRFGKYIKDMKKERIDPIRMNLWIHLRVQKNRKRKKEVSSLDKHTSNKNVSSPKNPSQPRIARRQTKKKKKNKKRKNKNRTRKDRKNKKGRKVKIFVTDGDKRLVTMRMRVKKTDWYMLELPISQFPSEINLNYTRTLCIQCKRCNKKIKIDIRSKRLIEENPKPTVPFIHIEPHKSLPQSYFRNINRRRRRQTRPRENRVPSPCCREDIHTVHIAKEFTNVLHPYSFNISLCKHLSRDQTARDTNIPLLSQQNTSISNQISLHSPPSLVQCAVESMNPLTLTYVDTLLNVKHMTIDDVLPTGCVCTYTRG